jgi:8-oxo-dGTP pyrophosphatase MutT (NUDIX family)
LEETVTEENAPAVPVPAATVIIGRDTQGGFETFMVVRHHQIDFASGALVFPGGKAIASDYLSEYREFSDGEAEIDADELAIRVAAIRETYEEAGFLLARRRNDKQLLSGARMSGLNHYRQLLNDQQVDFIDILKREELVLALDTLTPFAHWITPEMMPKRFDTIFFLASAPVGHRPEHDGGESVDSVWISPQQALKAFRQGTHQLIFPTRLNIEKLARYRSFDHLLSQARTAPIHTVLPWIEHRRDGDYLCIPTEADYDTTEEPLAVVMGLASPLGRNRPD